ncbi:hypothetical protein PO124_17580 [Bacillus licheniformis]|nr:hypothetical protein [Bacillus licheniformis]
MHRDSQRKKATTATVKGKAMHALRLCSARRALISNRT